VKKAKHAKKAETKEAAKDAAADTTPAATK
jgi:hypothetical protein